MNNIKKNGDNREHPPNKSTSTDAGFSNEDYELQERWEEIKGDFRSRYKDVTDDDIVYERNRPSSFGEMLGRIEKRIGRNRDQLKYDIRQWNPTDRRNK